MDLARHMLRSRSLARMAREYDELVDGMRAKHVYHVQAGMGSLRDTLTLSFRGGADLPVSEISQIATELLVAAGALMSMRQAGGESGALLLSVIDEAPDGSMRVVFPLGEGDELD